jgi:hypothetical protein
LLGAKRKRRSTLVLQIAIKANTYFCEKWGTKKRRQPRLSLNVGKSVGKIQKRQK